jgi:phage shock protein PspC (stress-responsive transcriptional regulator)
MTEAPPTPPTSDQAGAQQQPPYRNPFPQLRRSATDRMLGGVCGGLAEYSRIDPLLWRVGAVALALMGPGVFVYLLLWVLMTPPPGVPEQDMSPVDRAVTRLHDKLSGPRQAA